MSNTLQWLLDFHPLGMCWHRQKQLSAKSNLDHAYVFYCDCLGKEAGFLGVSVMSLIHISCTIALLFSCEHW